jgi:hypothetical protein
MFGQTQLIARKNGGEGGLEKSFMTENVRGFYSRKLKKHKDYLAIFPF